MEQNQIVSIFKNEEFGEVRTVMIDGEPWFVGKDVAVALGYTNPSKAMTDHVDEDDKLNNESLLGKNFFLERMVRKCQA